MIEISIHDLLIGCGFIGVWVVSYVITVLFRFGLILKWWGEAIMFTLSSIVPILMFTDLIKFVK